VGRVGISSYRVRRGGRITNGGSGQDPGRRGAGPSPCHTPPADAGARPAQPLEPRGARLLWLRGVEKAAGDDRVGAGDSPRRPFPGRLPPHKFDVRWGFRHCAVVRRGGGLNRGSAGGRGDTVRGALGWGRVSRGQLQVGQSLALLGEGERS